MAWKDKEKQREAIRKHYAANRDYYIQKSYKKREAVRQWVCELKSRTPCADCKVLYPYYVTDFDHIESRGKKASNISKLINNGSYSQVRAEIVKCELVCANCHRIRTFQRQEASNKL